jgi:hypothetical protein
MMIVELNPKEEAIIRKIAKTQLRALSNIMDEATEEDITMRCIENGIEKERVKKAAEKDWHMYKEVYDDPKKFLLILTTEDDLSIVKHILHTMDIHPSMKEAKQSVWYKMIVYDRLNINLQ